MALVKIPPYEPDLTDIGSYRSNDVINVVVRKDGFGPFKTLQLFTAALPAACRGYFFARKTDGSVAVFAGTATDLYLLNNTTLAWTNVSKSSPYSTLLGTDNWQFAQFNDLVIAVQQATVPQKFILSSGTTFVDLGGSPPQAGSVAVVGFFLLLTALQSNPRRAQWSDLAAPETWTAGVGLSDFEDLPDGGNCLGAAGGDAYGVIFQQESIRSLIYAPGSPAIFQINRLSTEETLFAKYSVINIGDRVFYCGAAGFKQIAAASPPTPIGKSRVDETFFKDVDQTNLQLCIGASDPNTTRVYWAYKSGAGQMGLFDKILAYDWALDAWSFIEQSGEYLASLSKPGITLEGLDAVALGAISVTGAANNGSGLIRLTVSALANAYFNIAGQNFIEVHGVVGTTEANGSWAVNIIDSHHIDLIGSTFTNAYVSGGAIGGSLETLTLSFDALSLASTVQLSLMDSSHSAGFFSGPNMDAIVETAEIDAEGQMVFTTQFLPVTDCSIVEGSIGYRNTPFAVVSYTGENLIDDTGQISVGPIESRYQRARMHFPMGAAWTFVTGIHPDTQTAGDR